MNFLLVTKKRVIYLVGKFGIQKDLIYAKFAEADVNTATPSLSNAAATWAGWAVTAVTSKFYRSQSDTANSRPTLTGSSMNKPGSLGKPYQ